MNKLLNAMLTACLAACALAAAPASGQDYPSKPVRVIVTFTSGGAADLTARLIGDKLGELWKQQVIVENRIGAGGNIGVEAVQRSAADGYTLLLLANTHAINVALYPKLPFDLMKDFVPIALTTSSPIVLAVNPRQKPVNLVQFTDMLRAQPGKLDYATCGVATAHHFAMELYKHATKTFAVHIPHRGCAPAVVDAVAGQVDIVIATMPAVLPYVKQNRLRAIALTTKERSPAAPDIPTFRESGIASLKDFEVENYYGFMAPAGTPKEIVAKLQNDLRTVLNQPELRQRLASSGLDPFFVPGDQMTAQLARDIEKFRRAIQIANVKPE
jgi:tripartite-type tricarboxylate transporter receptor subunit TctC